MPERHAQRPAASPAGKAAGLLVPQVADYLASVAAREPEVVTRLRAATQALPQAHYQIAPDAGQFLSFLIPAIGARRVLDIGTFTGYSALIAALALPPDGAVDTLDVVGDFIDIARRHWAEGGAAERIRFHLGPADRTLQALIDAGGAGSYDLALIDADKERYDRYFEQSLTLVRAGGVIVLDNMLWRGRVADPQDHGSKVEAFRALNGKIRQDDRVIACLLPLGDGVTVVYKRP